MRIFRDRPDITIPYLFYSVPDTSPGGLPTVVYPNWWDNMHGDHWDPEIGVVFETIRPYFGPVPSPGSVPLEGPAAFVNGYLHSDYLAGRIPVGFCFPVVKAEKTNLRQAQDIREAGTLERALLLQAQDVPALDTIQDGGSSPCDQMPRTMFATVTGSTSADGVYRLDTAAPNTWAFAGSPFGSCGGPAQKLVYSVDSITNVEHLRWWTGTGLVYRQCVAVDQFCDLFEEHWTMSQSGCGNTAGNTAHIRLSVFP